MYKVEFILKMLCLIILFCLKINIACSNQVSFLYFNFLLIYLFNGTLVSFLSNHRASKNQGSYLLIYYRTWVGLMEISLGPNPCKCITFLRLIPLLKRFLLFFSSHLGETCSRNLFFRICLIFNPVIPSHEYGTQWSEFLFTMKYFKF